jgi:hypothetical protein
MGKRALGQLPVEETIEGTWLASATRSATVDCPDMDTPGYRGVLVSLNVTAASGTGGLRVQLFWRDPASGVAQQLNNNNAPIAATGQNVHLFYPAACDAGVGIYVRWNTVLPRTWFARIQHGDGSNYTYSVGYALIR